MAAEATINELKNILPAASNILITLPAGANIDKLAAGLSLYLSLSQAGKQVSIVSPDAMRVAESHLFAVDKISQNIPPSGNNLTSIKLEGVEISQDGRVPALEKLDWHPEGNNILSLDFSVVSGQTFKPTNITPQYQGGSFNLIVVIGTSDLNSLSNIYVQNQQLFSSTSTVSVFDPNVSTSEIMVSVITGLGLPFGADEASNLLVGIFEATQNLTAASIAETYMAVAQCLRVGGRKPFGSPSTSSGLGAQGGSGIVTPQPQPQVQTAPQPQPAPQPTPPQPGFDLSALIPPQQPVNNQETFVNPTIAPVPSPAPTPSAEERPAGERVVSESEAEPDWLTPKIFKGSVG